MGASLQLELLPTFALQKLPNFCVQLRDDRASRLR
jgi:hypothetical protein